jgi:glycosyltransferase involved in cell wall biosynthesis
MEGGQDYVRERRWDTEQGGPIDINRVHYVNNGISLDEFKYNADNYTVYDDELTDKDTFKVIYLGSIRLANNLNQLLDAAKYLQDEPKIKIMIYGDGPEREKLEQRCEKEHIDNVKFKAKWTELKYVPYVLSCADLHILNYGKNWAPYGGSMNKMMMAFASGKPMICNADMPYSEINRHQLGVDKVFATPEDYAEAIKEIYRLPREDYDAMCGRVQEVAKRYDINYLCNKFAEYCEIL